MRIYSPGAPGRLQGGKHPRRPELDYDKLTLTVETNGTVTPDDALAYAARILQDQLQLFINFEEPRVGRPQAMAPR
jgi:DNA-directed RNA polymerase subunit alpha